MVKCIKVVSEIFLDIIPSRRGLDIGKPSSFLHTTRTTDFTGFSMPSLFVQVIFFFAGLDEREALSLVILGCEILLSMNMTNEPSLHKWSFSI